ncbi:MAG: sigma-70 family RNA polymerase sigma factor [Dehalococcoidia bacterium]
MQSLTEVSATVAAALNELPPEQRRVIELAYLGGLTHSEISRDLHVPLGTVKTRIRSGMQTLRDRLVTGSTAPDPKGAS